ncbi:MAG TPA: STM3941 family protein [Steroidobacteraceae bacterium]|nr:STM3941 family protein [Steroidobacteraceae bacterium]
MVIRHVRTFGAGLTVVYGSLALALAFGTFRGWFFQSDKPETRIAVVGLIVLIVATMLAEYVGAFKRSAAGRDALKGLAYWCGAIVWVLAVVRLVPDNRAGATVLIGPVAALMLAGVFYVARFAGTCTRAWANAIMPAASMPVPAPVLGNSLSEELPNEAIESGRVDVAANTGKICVRFLGGIAGMLILAQVVKRTDYAVSAETICYITAIFLAAMALRSLPNRAPALSLSAEGISVRRDLCAITRLPWAEIVGFEMKSALGNTFLVIQVKDAEELIAQRRPISRWVMGQSVAKFGSPVRIPVSWLKCDPGWLWQKVNEMLMNARPSNHPSKA